MAVQPGMRRLKEFDYLTELSKEARQALDIPEDAEVVKITDHWKEDGPIVISYTRKTGPEQRAENRRRLQNAIDKAIYAIEERCRNDPEYFAALKEKYNVTE